jgi:hypothetical protein
MAGSRDFACLRQDVVLGRGPDGCQKDEPGNQCQAAAHVRLSPIAQTRRIWRVAGESQQPCHGSHCQPYGVGAEHGHRSCEIPWIRRHLYEQHKEWMIRSYVVTTAFVTFRLFFELLRWTAIGTIVERLTAMAWLSWAIPLLVTEAVLQGRKILASRD